jgi:protein-S-isoprenylcysteine O-methyltransferase Ste14
MVGVAAGRFDLPFVWALGGLLALHRGLTLLAMDPSLIAERAWPGPGARDRVLRRLLVLCVFGQWITAGLDVGRFHWTEGMPLALQGAGLLVLAAALGVASWAVASNRFFSSAVRIQAERGHTVVSGGPYRFVRHPGYLAGLVAAFSGSLVLGSWLSLIPTVSFAAIYLWRLAREDALLQRELAGYSEYAARVRFRLIPLVW